MPNSLICNIHWNVLTFPEWDEKFKHLNRANLLQSYAYAQSTAAMKGQRPRWGVIKVDDEEAGLVQIFEVGVLKNAIHAVILDRGPLWFEGFGKPKHIKAFFTEFNRQFLSRIGRKRRIIPETDIDLTSLGYKKAVGSYETIWIDLQNPIETLKKDIRKNWRGTLNKAEKQDFQIEWDETGAQFPWLIQNYAVDKAAKGYDGPSVKLVKTLTKYHSQREELLIGRAILKGEAVAGVLILKHGAAATYQIGFSSDAGRKHGAHHILLWNALSHLKYKGIKDFDLGGINEDTAKGVKQFKTGMGGQTVKLAGMYT